MVDSDDWLDEESLKELLSELREWEWQEKEVDLVVCNYVYDHLYENKTKPMRYTNVFPEKKLCTWNDMGNFKPSQYLVMHALLYRTQKMCIRDRMPAVQNRPKAYGLTILIYEKMVSCCSHLR